MFFTSSVIWRELSRNDFGQKFLFSEIKIDKDKSFLYILFNYFGESYKNLPEFTYNLVMTGNNY